ncbi:MAG: hypothetical protein K2K38_06395 [Clostridia bacterium]|nr:hypothetical protein [Clostridia bacterium]
MDKYGKIYCRKEERISKEQFLMDIFLLIKSEYIAKINCNGENITVQLLNGQAFILRPEEL